MGEIGAAEALAGGALGDGSVDPRKVGLARGAAPLGDAAGHLADACVELGRHACLLDRPGGQSVPSSAKAGEKKDVSGCCSACCGAAVASAQADQFFGCSFWFSPAGVSGVGAAPDGVSPSAGAGSGVFAAGAVMMRA